MAGLIGKLRKLSLDSWLLTIGSIFVVLLLLQAVRYAWTRKLGAELIEASLLRTASPGRPDVKELKEYQIILEKAHLGKETSSAPKQPQLFGILGESALMGNSPKDIKPYAVGAQLPGGFKLLEMHLNSVVIEKDGKKQTIVLFPELGAKPGPPAPQPPAGQEPPRPPEPEQPPTASEGDETKSTPVGEERPEDEEEIRARKRKEMRENLEMRDRGRRRGIIIRRDTPRESE